MSKLLTEFLIGSKIYGTSIHYVFNKTEKENTIHTHTITPALGIFTPA